MRRIKVQSQVNPIKTRLETQLPGGSALPCFDGVHMSSGPTAVKVAAPARSNKKNMAVQRVSNQIREVKAFLRTSSTKIIAKVRAKPRAPITTRYVSIRVSRPRGDTRLAFQTATDARTALQMMKTAKTRYRSVTRKFMTTQNVKERKYRSTVYSV